MSVNLGDKVKDPVTGFEGIAISKTEFLNGCYRIGVQPKIDKEGKVVEASFFDEPQLVVTKKKVVPVGERVTGGVMNAIPSRNSGARR